MDVRCDRCQTEYELDDDSVPEAGAPVQCTACGHTFKVARGGGGGAHSLPVTPPAGVAPFPSPGAPDWELVTEEGRSHRFRDLTTLQKWIVERRVTPGDRVSQRGGSWRRLSDVEELQPFFEVVAQADRGQRNESPYGGRTAPPSIPRHPVENVAADAGADVFAEGRRPRPPALDSGSFDASFAADDELVAAAGFGRRGRTLKIAAGLGIGAVAAIGAGYLGFKEPHGFRSKRGGEAASLSAPAPAPAPPVAAPVAQAVAVPPPAAAPPPAPPSPPVAAAPAAPPPPPAPALVNEQPTPAAVPPAPAAGAAGDQAAAKPRTYEQLIAEADHALENGHTSKAQKLYDDALKLQPEGPEAIAGSAYLLLDRQRPLAAISLFKRALAGSPGFAPALFGLGEAYRAQGDNGHALEAYRRYLDEAPGGADAPAARRQVRDLASGAGSGGSPSGESAKADTPSGAASASGPKTP